MTTTSDTLLNDLMPAWNCDGYGTATDLQTLRRALAKCAALYLTPTRHDGDPDGLRGSCRVLVEITDWPHSDVLVPDYICDLDVQAGEGDDDAILQATAEQHASFDVGGRRFYVFDVDGE